MTQAGLLDEVNVRRSGMSGVTTESRPVDSLLERLLSALLGKSPWGSGLLHETQKGEGSSLPGANTGQSRLSCLFKSAVLSNGGRGRIYSPERNWRAIGFEP